MVWVICVVRCMCSCCVYVWYVCVVYVCGACVCLWCDVWYMWYVWYGICVWGILWCMCAVCIVCMVCMVCMVCVCVCVLYSWEDDRTRTKTQVSIVLAGLLSATSVHLKTGSELCVNSGNSQETAGSGLCETSALFFPRGTWRWFGNSQCWAHSRWINPEPYRVSLTSIFFL